jgi:hypothetical protein
VVVALVVKVRAKEAVAVVEEARVEMGVVGVDWVMVKEVVGRVGRGRVEVVEEVEEQGEGVEAWVMEGEVGAVEVE